MQKYKQVKAPQTAYRVNHHLYGQPKVFMSWISLVDSTIDIAKEYAQHKLASALIALTEEIADEMIATAEGIDLD
jgi:mevalonate pyrophosphate decarboxylase